MATLIETRGYIAVVGEQVEKSAKSGFDSFINVIQVPKDYHPHITLFTKSELSQLKSRNIKVSPQELNISTKFVDLGLGSYENVYFKVVVWYEGNDLRKKLGFPPKHFHITLSKTDNHEISKNFKTLCEERRLTDDELAYIMEHGNDIDFLMFIFQRYASDKLFDLLFQKKAWKTREELIQVMNDNSHLVAPMVRFAMMNMRCEPKLAMIYLLSAREKSSAKKLTDFIESKLRALSLQTDWGYLLSEEEYERYVQDTPLFQHLELIISQLAIHPLKNLHISEFMMETINDNLYQMASRQRSVTIKGERMFRFFRYIIPFSLAVSSTPRNEQDIDILQNYLHFDVVYTLTEEEPLNEKWFYKKKIYNIFVAVENYKVPTFEEVEDFINLVVSGKKVLIHCGGGKGRAGTFIACYLMHCGFSLHRSEFPVYTASQCMSILRQMRPGSIETQEQEKFIQKFEKWIWQKNQANDEQKLVEPNTELYICGKFSPSPQLIILCGLQGSGKSTFSLQLAQHSNYVHTSQDDCEGGKQEFTEKLMQLIRQKKKIIVDKCNVTKKARKELLDLAFNPRDVLCIFFNVEKNICIQRANERKNHATIKQGKAETPVNSMYKMLEEPTLSEGFCCVMKVSSFSACEQALKKFNAQSTVLDLTENQKSEDVKEKGNIEGDLTNTLIKFPRTRHLYNLGCASRDDLILDAAKVSQFLKLSPGTKLIIEEKVDGANMGISIDVKTLGFLVQNRSHYITSKSHVQFSKLDLFLDSNKEDLWRILTNDDTVQPGRLILYGEWLTACHSIHYTKLPDVFLAFDVYDKVQKCFFTREQKEKLLNPGKINLVKELGTYMSGEEKQLTKEYFQKLVKKPSYYYDGMVEGVYVRKETTGVHGKLLDRAKVVRQDFLSGNEHWSKNEITKNIVMER